MTRSRDALALAERMLGILDDGSFSATYKFAVVLALLDVCIENTARSGVPPSSITTRQLAERVLELYWSHAVPFREHGVLRQGGNHHGQQAEILRDIDRFRIGSGASGGDTLHRAKLARPREYQRLLNAVEWKLIEMPIPRLQVLGRTEDRFLYEYAWGLDVRPGTIGAYQRGSPGAFDNRLNLKPGVSEHLVRLNGILRPLFQREWARKVARMNELPEAELESFLFGTDRVPLDAVRRPLLELQSGRCFYCDVVVNSRADVDHFLPWSRYADDGLDNLVVAHDGCNASKSAFLAAASHVERWRARLREHDTALDAIAEHQLWRRSPSRTLSVARALYLKLPETARLWESRGSFVGVDRARLGPALD